MPRLAFRLKLHPGQAAEYQRRHDALWPELKRLLKETGISDYSIFLDPETNLLFGVMNVLDSQKLDDLPSHPVMKKWWAYMGDIMQSNADGSPVVEALPCMFHMD